MIGEVLNSLHVLLYILLHLVIHVEILQCTAHSHMQVVDSQEEELGDSPELFVALDFRSRTRADGVATEQGCFFMQTEVLSVYTTPFLVLPAGDDLAKRKET